MKVGDIILYSANEANFVLGNVLNNPTLLFSDKYKLNKNDFAPLLLHKIIFVCAYNLAIKNVKEIDIISIEEWLKNHKAQYKVFEDNDGASYVEMIKKLSSENTFDFYYDRVKLYSVLREYKKQGFDIGEIFDETTDDESVLSEWNSEKVIDYFERKQVEIKKEFQINLDIEKQICGEDGLELINSLEEKPDIGNGVASPYYNELMRGWKRSNFILIGASTAFGKSLMACMHLCAVACDRVWSEKKQCYIKNPQYVKGTKGCFIFTEQTMKEIQLRFFSTISKVNYGKIMDGDLTTEEKERVLEASKIAKECGLKLINCPNFTVKIIKTIMQEIALDGYTHASFDYLWAQPALIQEYKKENGGNINETSVLLNLASVLKTESERLNLACWTSMQLNGKEKNEIVDVDCLFASRAVSTKCDFVGITTHITKKQLALTQDLVQEWNNQNNKNGEYNIFPNMITHVVKARYGRYGNIKIYSNLDRGTATVKDMFCTIGVDEKPIDVARLLIKGDNNE